MNKYTPQEIKDQKIVVICHNKEQTDKLAKAWGWKNLWDVGDDKDCETCWLNNSPAWVKSSIHTGWFIKNYGFTKTIDFSQVNFDTMNKKIIGYKLNGKVGAKEVAQLLECQSDVNSDGLFFWGKHITGNTVKKAKELGILDLWFYPVYENEKIMIGEYEVKLQANGIMVDNDFYPIALLSKIKETFENYPKIKYLACGCSGNIKVDLELVNKILNRLV